MAKELSEFTRRYVILKGYESYFKPAREGGRGYMVFSEKLVTALLEIKDLTTLRIFLHQLIESYFPPNY